MVERFSQIAKANLKHNLFPHLLIAGAFLLIAPLLMGLEYLNARSTAQVLEQYVVLIGIILLTPIFLPEQDKDIRGLVRTKYTNTAIIAGIRILEAAACLVLLTGAFLLVMKHGQCIFPAGKFLWGTLAGAVFLGGMGLCAYAIFDQIAVAYMLPMVYFLINLSNGNRYVKDFFLFSMAQGSYKEKYYLAGMGVVFILIGIGYPYIVRKLLPGLSPLRIKQ